MSAHLRHRAALLGTVFTFALGTVAVAQNPIAYPHDTVRAGSGNLTPFGVISTGTSSEGRWQQLIPAHYLPSAGGVITGMAVNCQSSTATVTYTSLIITLSHTPATSLGTSASGNLPAPVPVLNVTNHPIPWSINAWTPITFTIPFPYNGVDNLVIDIQKVHDPVTNPVPGVVTHQTTGSPHRTDLVPARYTFSAFGAGGSTSDNLNFSSSAVLSMRLMFLNQGTTTIASQSNNVEFTNGTPATLGVWGANGTGWATFLDTMFRTPSTFPWLQGQLHVLPLTVVGSGVTAGGSSLVNFTIPPDPTLVGSYWVMQSVTLDPSRTTLAMTNAVDFFVR